MPSPVNHLKRFVLMAILAISWVGSGSAWLLMESLGLSSPVLHFVFGLNLVFHPVLLLIVWRNLLPLRIVDMACLLFAAGLCGACMALRLYSPAYGASIDIQPLYLWIPVIYVFAFTLTDHRSSLRIALAIMALFVVISLPYLLFSIDQPFANFTVQLHMVSAVLIVALYFFSGYQHRFQLAQISAKELALLANTDDLTQLPNRRRMAEAIDAELVRHARYGHAFSIVLIDIDHFKMVNDHFGHRAGDQALVALSSRSRAALRDADILGRWGGEEFVAILPETGFDETLRKGAALCAHIAATPLMADLVITISCGVTSVIAGDSADSLLQRADEALYAAKHRGRNRAEGVRENRVTGSAAGMASPGSSGSAGTERYAPQPGA